MINKKYLKKRKLLSLFSIFLISIIAINTISMVSAADITIDSNSTGGIKEAVKIAKDGDTINLKNGVYKGLNNTEITINKSITIKGLGSKVILDGERKNQIFTITGKKVSLNKLKFTKGYTKYDGGAILHEEGSLTLNNCIFTNNQAKDSGGAIYSMNYDLKVIMSKCTFKNNQAKDSGGAIYALNLIVSKCNFTNNQALHYDGGAIHVHTVQGELGTLTVSNSIFKNNQATKYKYSSGGAIAIGGKSTVNKCTFKNNQANYDGGAIDCAYGSLTVNNSIFTSNKAKNKGGAIITGNTGDIWNIATGKIINSKFRKNTAGKVYNAIYAYKGSKFTTKNVSITPKFGTKVKK